MGMINKQRYSYRSQSSVGGVEESVGRCVILWTYPFAFQHTPERLRDVEMRRIWRQVEKEESPTLPHGSHFLYDTVSVNACVVKHNNHVSCSRSEGQPVEEVRHHIGCYATSRGETLVAVVSGCHSKDVEPGNLLGRDEHILPTELPAIRHVAFGADVAFIGVEEVYPPFFCLLFKFLQLLYLVFVELRRGFSPWAFPYTLISCASAAKKRLNVDSLASLPVACCHASRALFTLWRSCSIASRTASSSEQSIIGLRPLPGLVSRPLMPSVLYRHSHLFTVCCSMSTLLPTFSADIPSAFSSTARHLIRKQCFSPRRYPFSSSRLCASVNSKRVVLLISNVYFTEITRNAA